MNSYAMSWESSSCCLVLLILYSKNYNILQLPIVLLHTMNIHMLSNGTDLIYCTCSCKSSMNQQASLNDRTKNGKFISIFVEKLQRICEKTVTRSKNDKNFYYVNR